MSSKELKVLRGQIRQIVKELLPEVFKEELVKAVESKIYAEMTTRLTLMDQRQLDFHSYVVRNSAPMINSTKNDQKS